VSEVGYKNHHDVEISFSTQNPNNGKELDKLLLLSFPTSFYQLIGGKGASIR
jgi:hypothetical protein